MPDQRRRPVCNPLVMTSQRDLLIRGGAVVDGTSRPRYDADVRVPSARQLVYFDSRANPEGRRPDDTWVLRNISISIRTAPKRDNPDMYEIRSENPENALTPGRYALVLKGQAYDFNVAGAVTDPKQCLEQVAATNGKFYSECRKP